MQRLTLQLVIPGGGFPSCFLFSKGCATRNDWDHWRTMHGSCHNPPYAIPPAALQPQHHSAPLFLRARGPNDSSSDPGKCSLTARQGSLVPEKCRKDFRNREDGETAQSNTQTRLKEKQNHHQNIQPTSQRKPHSISLHPPN